MAKVKPRKKNKPKLKCGNDEMAFALNLALRLLAEIPAADVIPVEWLEAQVDKGKWGELVQRWREANVQNHCP